MNRWSFAFHNHAPAVFATTIPGPRLRAELAAQPYSRLDAGPKPNDAYASMIILKLIYRPMQFTLVHGRFPRQMGSFDAEKLPI
jgi:hypothetical protein